MLDKDSTDFMALKELDLETDALFTVLVDSRRRFVLACLDEYATPMALSDIADELATWEQDTQITEISASDIQSIYISLYHKHIPKMEDNGVVEYSQERDAVTLTETGEELTSIVDFDG